MDNHNEIIEIGDLVCNSSGLISVAIDYCEFHTETPLQITLECAQKILSEAMERLSRLW